ncbi:hypothetical protein [Nocardia concava]|uniref:hypothetical protein n=1 Tax=Nocardia concava TaxID=257281 RepID=UPI000315F840|nr:hypothetical protein [Nocardia concava]
MQKRTVRRTVTAGVLGAAALGVLAIPAVANAATPDSVAALVDTGSAGPAAPVTPAVPGGPGVLVTQDQDGNVTVRPAEPGMPIPPGAVPAIPLQPGTPGPGQHVIIQRDDRGPVPGSPADTIVVSPAR